MGAISGLVGAGGGVNGTGITGPQATQITPGTTAAQLQTAYGGAQGSLQSQQALLAALQQQNGLQNQSQVYNQLQGVASGAVNPAQAQFAQNTAQNVGNQAALLAGQRGASGNVGLMGRQIAQNQAGIQQQAVGQEATQQANNQINALGQAGQLATTQAGQQIAGTTANTQAQQSEQQLLQGANSAQNSANVSMQGNINSANAGLANTTMQGQQALIGGAANGAGAIAGLARGGMVQKYAGGGSVSGPQSSFGQFLSGWSNPMSGSSPEMTNPQFSGPGAGSAALQKGIGNSGKGIKAGMTPSPIPSTANMNLTMPTMGSQFSGTAPNLGVAGIPEASSAPGLGVGSLGSAGAPPFARGGNVGSKLKSGGAVPGKAEVSGNSLKNDKVKALLSPGEGVIDRETMQDQGPMGKSARLLMSMIEAKKKGRK